MSCPDCFRGGISFEKPTGSETTIHGLRSYVARPAEGVTPKAVIVFIPDAFGWEFVNNRVLCDRYAQRGGYLVYLPDFMNGHSMDTQVIGLLDHVMEPAPTWVSFFGKPWSFVKMLWFVVPWKKKAAISVCYPRVVKFIQDIRTASPPFDTSSLKIGVAGFCWGGKHAILLSHDDSSVHVKRHESQASNGDPEPLVDCLFTAHPSYLDVPQDIDAMKLPTSISVGDQDAVLKADGAKEAKAIVDKMEQHEMRIEPGAKHGFAVRMHPENNIEVECAERAEEQALAWFHKWLA